MILIHAIERRFRSLGYEPVRHFDARNRWTLSIEGVVIARAKSLSELALAAQAWLLTLEHPRTDGVEHAPSV